MKKLLPLFFSLIISFVAFSQTPQSDPQDLRREMYKTFNKRVYSNEYPLRELPVVGNSVSDKTKSKASNSKTISGRVWFPGEWEEVKAIIVTPPYDFLVPGHEHDNSWYAYPIVSGYADYYHYTMSGYQLNGIGPYISAMDTASEFSKVFFRIIDGIQLGGAQAWVHVEQLSDTAIVHRTLARMNLRHDNIYFFCGPGNSIWYRDCGPICFYYGDQDSLAMLDFIYSRHRRSLDDSIPSLLHRQMGIPNFMTKVLWEGGNCLVDGAGTLISSDAVYTTNRDTVGQITWDGHDINTLHNEYKPALTPPQVKQALHDMLGQRATYIIPRYLYDGGTGHIDLYADAYNENGFVFSCMPDAYSSWNDYTIGHNNIDSLCSYMSIFDREYYTMGRLPFPSKDNGGNFNNQTEYNRNYSRTYSNHTFVNNVILQPCFSTVGADGMPTAAWDRANIEKIKAEYPGYTIYCIDVRTFDGSGGAIHCVTKQIPADNPVRILHKNIHDTVNTGSMTSIPFSAIITNRSGIDHAEVMYRSCGGEWNCLNLTDNGNRWYGSIPISSLDTINTAKGSIKVEYYITATSNNGKSVTKPITANQGSYFNFTLGNDDAVDSTMFDFNTQDVPLDDITFTFGSDWLIEDTTGNGNQQLAIERVDMEDDFGQFYPNPANDKANININCRIGDNYTVTIVDNSGRTVHTSTINAAGQIVFTINTSRLAQGIYTVVFSNGRSHATRRLIVK